MTLHEISEASKIIQEEADDNANILFGAVINEQIKGEVRVTVIATGFNKPQGRSARPSLNHGAGAAQHQGYSQAAHGLSQTASRQPPSQADLRAQPQVGLQAQPVQGRGQYPSGASRHAPAMGGILASESLAVGGKQEIKNDLKDLAREIGVLEYQNDEYDIPTFLRKQAD